nr:ubiquitin hydrolase [Tanacetum cinerariifolium]
MRIPIISEKDKGKEKVTKTKVPKKKKLQEQIDAQVAREMEEEFARENQRLSEQAARDCEIARIYAEEELKLMIEGLDRSNEVIAKHLNEYEQAKVDLSVGEKIELINIFDREDLHQLWILVKETFSIKLLGIKCTRHSHCQYRVPLVEEVPITSEEGCHCQKKRDATTKKIALLSKSRRNCQSKSNDSFTNFLLYTTVPLHLTYSSIDLQRYNSVVSLLFHKKNNIQDQQKKIMVKSSSCSKNEPCCSKDCKKNTEALNKKITDLEDKLVDAKNMIYHYKLGLELVESRLVECKEREVKYCEKIRTFKFRTESSNECIEILKKKLETLKQEKERVDGKLAGLLTSSKDLDNLIESQRADKNKEGLGYKFVDDTVTDYIRPSPTIESTSGDDQNKNPSVTKIGASDSTILSKPAIKFVKSIGKATERPKTDKVETAKKPTVRYAKLYKKPSKKSTVRGNQRNWNNLKSQQLANNFVMKKKACYNCGHFDHLSYDCRLGVKIGRSSPKNNYTHMSMTPRSAINRPYRPPMRPMRPNMNAARPIKTSFYKPAHSYTKRPFQETTQDLMIILIHKVKRLEKELKARTLVYKVDRGRFRHVMAWVPKKV